MKTTALRLIEPSLVELALRRRAEIASYDGNPPDDDDELYTRSCATYLRTEDAMARTVLRSKDDALAAIDLIREDFAMTLECAPLGDALLVALRRFIERDCEGYPALLTAD